MPITLKILPIKDNGTKINIPPPVNGLTFLKYQDVMRAFGKHYEVTLLDPRVIGGIPLHRFLEFLVVDGQHRKFSVQRCNEIWQCSCHDFIENQANHCEHIALLSAVIAYPFHIPNGYLISQAIRSRLSLLNHQFEYVIYEGINNEVVSYSVGRHKIGVPVIESCAIPTFNMRRKVISSGVDLSSYTIDSSGILGSSLKLFDYQEKIFKELLLAKKAICSMEMGSGKTLTSIACFGWIRKHLKPHAKLLVICPKSLKLQWASEIKRALGIDSLLINGLKHLSVLSSSNIHIATYQFFARHANEFAKFDYDLVIMDEIQFIRNEESKVWKAAKKIKTEFFFGLSGTVIENKLDDLYAIMDVIAPDFLGPKWKFSTEYQELISVTRKVLIFVGVRNIDKLREKIKTKVFGYNKLTLPAITHTYKNVAMTKQQQTVHDDYYGMAQRLLAKSMTSGLNYGEKMLLQSLLLKSRQSANTIELIDKNPSPNSPKITSIITDLASYSNTNRKVVVFSQWTEFLDILARELGKLNIKFVYYTGRETERQRLKSVETFSNDPAVTVFLASDAGGVGLDGLQKAASVVIHTELPWNPARLDQRTGRVYRLGQTQPVEAVYYYAKNSIEEKILDVLQGKRDIRSFALKPMNE